MSSQPAEEEPSEELPSAEEALEKTSPAEGRIKMRVPAEELTAEEITAEESPASAGCASRGAHSRGGFRPTSGGGPCIGVSQL